MLAMYKPTEPQLPPERGAKAARYALMISVAMEIIRTDGHIPTVAEVAVRSKISRATAYRYFPSRSALITSVIENSLGPIRLLGSNDPDGQARVRELFRETFPRFKEFEPQLRAAAQLSLEQWALEKAGLLEETPYRRGHRIRILEHALKPLASKLTPEAHTRLHRALSIVYGIEPYIILKDIWGLNDKQVEKTALWMAEALVDSALRESSGLVANQRANQPAKRKASKSDASVKATRQTK